jgi:ATP-dependent RNA helicase SUPV3L1/SUV3
MPLRGRLTERLLAQGLLTPNMLQELRKEWDNNQNQSSNRYANSDDEDDPSPFKKFRRKRTVKK